MKSQVNKGTRFTYTFLLEKNMDMNCGRNTKKISFYNHLFDPKEKDSHNIVDEDHEV